MNQGPRAGQIVAVFGLSADPPTGEGGHAGIVRWCASELTVPARRGEPDSGLRRVDEVWVLPVYRHIFRAKTGMTAYEHRLAMARLAFTDLEGARVPVRVLETERELQQAAAQASRPPPTTRIGTYDVMRRLMRDSPSTRFVLVLGADTYADLRAGKWAHSIELQDLVEVVALPRVGLPFAGTVPTPPNLDPVSSSLARSSTDLAYLRRALQPQVLDYILEHRLYTVGQRVAPARGEA